MAESSVPNLEPSSGNIRTSVRRTADRRRLGTTVPSVRAVPIHFGKSKIGIIAQALWGNEATARLAKLLQCTKRHAGLLIDGKRKLNARGSNALQAFIID